MRSVTAMKAYRAASSHRGQREQDAEIFRRANASLRSAQTQGGMAQVRAIAENAQLWTLVIDLLRDPGNPLPPPLRGSMISVGLAVRRELTGEDPNLDFVIGVNEQFAAGLAGAN